MFTDSHGYVGLGNLAPESSCRFFWERAGLRTENVLRVLRTLEKITSTTKLQGFEIVNAGAGPKKQLEKFQLVAIPLLKVVAASGKDRGDNLSLLSDAPMEGMIAAPKDWCPNPAYTSCLRVRGNSMSPLIHDGYFVAVDSSPINLDTLNGRIVIAWHKDTPSVRLSHDLVVVWGRSPILDHHNLYPLHIYSYQLTLVEIVIPL